MDLQAVFNDERLTKQITSYLPQGTQEKLDRLLDANGAAKMAYLRRLVHQDLAEVLVGERGLRDDRLALYRCGKTIRRSMGGQKVPIRMGPTLHAAFVARARSAQMSQGGYIAALIERAWATSGLGGR